MFGALEHSFLHDMNNVLQGLAGTSEILVESLQGEDLELVEQLQSLARRMCGEIALQRTLIESERYVPRAERIEVRELLEDVRRALSCHPAAFAKSIDSVPPPTIKLKADRFLVERILTNMVINALEATPEGGHVRVSVEVLGESIQLAVRNSGFIAEEVQPRVFQRYFSTKAGVGRGQGTFAMKLFGERLLGGKVSFTSDEKNGTEFVLQLPVDP